VFYKLHYKLEPLIFYFKTISRKICISSETKCGDFSYSRLKITLADKQKLKYNIVRSNA